jgi:hypothetical protein
MTTIPPRDPCPGRPLLFRIDLRAGPDTVFWSRVRKAFLPHFSGSCFWVTDNPVYNPQRSHPEHNVILSRALMIQYVPNFRVLSYEQCTVLRERYWTKSPNLIYDSAIITYLNASGLVRSGRITTLGWNSYFLS